MNLIWDNNARLNNKLLTVALDKLLEHNGTSWGLIKIIEENNATEQYEMKWGKQRYGTKGMFTRVALKSS